MGVKALLHIMIFLEESLRVYTTTTVWIWQLLHIETSRNSKSWTLHFRCRKSFSQWNFLPCSPFSGYCTNSRGETSFNLIRKCVDFQIAVPALFIHSFSLLLQSTKSSGFGLILQLFLFDDSLLCEKHFCALFCCSNRMKLRNPIWRCDACWTKKKGEKCDFSHRRLCFCTLIIVSYRRSFPISLSFLDYRFSSSHPLFLLLSRLSRAK